MEKTLCNINMDMVWEWLTKCQANMCLMRTTYGNPHYINDVVENYYRYVGEGNRERVQNRSSSYPVPQRIVSHFGADETVYYSIQTPYRPPGPPRGSICPATWPISPTRRSSRGQPLSARRPHTRSLRRTTGWPCESPPKR